MRKTIKIVCASILAATVTQSAEKKTLTEKFSISKKNAQEILDTLGM